MLFLATHIPEVTPVIPGYTGAHITTLLHLYQGLLSAHKKSASSASTINSEIILGNNTQLDLGQGTILLAGNTQVQPASANGYPSYVHKPAIMWPKGGNLAMWDSAHTHYLRKTMTPRGIVIQQSPPSQRPIETIISGPSRNDVCRSTPAYTSYIGPRYLQGTHYQLAESQAIAVINKLIAFYDTNMLVLIKFGAFCYRPAIDIQIYESTNKDLRLAILDGNYTNIYRLKAPPCIVSHT